LRSSLPHPTASGICKNLFGRKRPLFALDRLEIERFVRRNPFSYLQESFTGEDSWQRDIVDIMRKEAGYQLIVRNLEEEVVFQLKLRAAGNGRSAEAEHREILREALLPERSKRSLKDLLLAMPEVGDDVDFERDPDTGRSFEL
jgi:plasmid stability protein